MKKTPFLPDSRETALGWVYFCLYVFLLSGIFRYVNMLLPKPLSDVRLNFLFALCNLISVVFIARRFLWRSLILAVRLPFRTLRAAGIAFVLYYCTSFLLGLLIALLRPDFSNVNDSAIAAMTRENYTLMTLEAVIMVPVVEEFLFRALLFGQVYPKRPIAAYALSTALFSAIHVVGYVGQHELGYLALSYLQYIPAGLLLAWAYAQSGTLWAPILVHMTINQIGIQTVR